MRPSTKDRLAFVGRAPVGKVAAPMGSYLAVLRKRGYRDVRLPVSVGRNEDVASTVKLYTDARIGEGFVYVPGGPFISGGDAKVNIPERRVREVGDFFIGRYPVTCAEYLQFLNELARRGREQAKKHGPRWQEVGGLHWEESESGVWTLPEGKDAYGLCWAADQPVVEVTWHDANAYCAWRSGRDGRTVSLPSEWEWEKAARGTDGRLFPWGNRFEPLWCNMMDSRATGGSRIGPVEEFAEDETLYGVRGMAGNARDWCQELWVEDKDWRLLRGGCWDLDAANCRAAFRRAGDASVPDDGRGFRLVVREVQDS